MFLSQISFRLSRRTTTALKKPHNGVEVSQQTPQSHPHSMTRNRSLPRVSSTIYTSISLQRKINEGVRQQVLVRAKEGESIGLSSTSKTRGDNSVGVVAGLLCRGIEADAESTDNNNVPPVFAHYFSCSLLFPPPVSAAPNDSPPGTVCLHIMAH